MGRFDTKPEDWDKAVDEGEKAGDASSLFITKRLKKDLDTIYIAFLEIPRFGTVVYEDKSSEKGQANVVSFGEDGKELEEDVYILEMAPMHINRFLNKLRKPQYGLAKVYEIERHGAPNYTKTYYEMELVRDLTQAEIDHLETVEMHALFTRGDSTASTSPPPASQASTVSVFMKRCGEEAVRLGWAADQETMKSNLVIANKTFFRGFIPSNEMSDWHQSKFLEALGAVEKGQQPAEIGYLNLDDNEPPIDLNEDVNFF